MRYCSLVKRLLHIEYVIFYVIRLCTKQNKTQFSNWNQVKKDMVGHLNHSSISHLSPGTTRLLRLPSANDGRHPEWHNWAAGEGIWGAARHLSRQSSSFQRGSGFCGVGLWTRRPYAQYLTSEFFPTVTLTQTQQNKTPNFTLCFFVDKGCWLAKCQHVNNS